MYFSNKEDTRKETKTLRRKNVECPRDRLCLMNRSAFLRTETNHAVIYIHPHTFLENFYNCLFPAVLHRECVSSAVSELFSESGNIIMF